MRRITIELRTNFDTTNQAEKEQAMLEAAKTAAKHLFATAALMSPEKRKPQIAVYTDDFYAGVEEIQLADDIPEDL